MLDLLYRRPKSAPSLTSSIVAEEDVEKYLSANSSTTSIHIAGIPPSLSFDRIMTSGTCPPCTVRDFMHYLVNIEHGGENLQFWLWYQDYKHRFELLSEEDKRLSPEWTREMAAACSTMKQGQVLITPTTAEMNAPSQDNAEGLSSETPQPLTTTSSNPVPPSPLQSPPGTPPSRSDMSGYWDESLGKSSDDKVPANYREMAANAYRSVNKHWQPHYEQPFRDEIARIIALYIVEGSPRELNLTSRDRREVLCALERTTHFSAFQDLRVHVEWTLRNQSHPNFIRWAICNGNRPRVLFARGLGISLIILGVLVDFLLTLSHAGRPWRAISAGLLILGIATLIAAWKGMCVVLHGLHARQLKPWELFPTEENDIDLEMDKKIDDDYDLSGFESQPWIVQYEKRNVIRKVFDKQVWIQEPALRKIQDAIFLQSILVAIFITAIIVGIFVALPKGRLF